MKLPFVFLVIFAASQAEPLSFRSPMNLINPGVTAESTGPLGVFIKGVMTGSRFDVHLIAGLDLLDSSILLSISFRSIGSSIIFNSNVKDLDHCIDPDDCFLGELPNPPADTSFNIEQGMPIDLEIISDELFWHVFINGASSLSIRQRVRREVFEGIVVEGGLSTASIKSGHLMNFGTVPALFLLRYRTPLLLDINRNLPIRNIGPQTLSFRGLRTGPSFVFHLTTGENRWQHNTLVSVSITSDTVTITSNLVDLSQCVSNCTLGQITYKVMPVLINIRDIFNFHIVTDYSFLQIYINTHRSGIIPHRIGLEHASNLIIEGGVELLDVEQRSFHTESVIPLPYTSGGVVGGSAFAKEQPATKNV